MNKLKWILPLIVLLIAAPAFSGWADKVTVDPNAPGVQRQASPGEGVDARLAQKITYDSGYKRLHVVADDIAKISGVSIACGKSPKDWRVRDIPVVVYVKNMPLGKLLRAVADATHTRVASERVGDNPVRHYRIYRRLREQQAIENLITEKHEKKLAQAQWQWDAAVAYGKSGREIPDVDKLLSPVAKLIASLGPNARDEMLDGETFSFRGSDPACRGAIAELQQAVWEMRLQGGNEKLKDVPAPTARDTKVSSLAIKIVDEGEMGDTSIDWVLSPSPAVGQPSSSSMSDLSSAEALDGKGLNLPPYPRDVPVAEPNLEIDNARMSFMARKKPEDWNYPPLQAQIDVAKPECLKDATFADAIRALAKASGCNIVVEDFASHMDTYFQNVESVFAKDTTVADRLQNLHINGYGVRYSWFFGKDNKLLVGWASMENSSDRFTWLDHHRNLLPERYLNDLKSKLNGPGVQFDDAVSLTNITMGSGQEWILRSSVYDRLRTARPALNIAVWRLYDSLPAADKALAKSDGGLPLAKLDPGLTAEFFRSYRMMQFPFFTSADQKLPDSERIVLDDRTTSDPKVIATMALHVTSRPVTRRMVRVKPGFGFDADTFAPADVPAALKLSMYSILIDYAVGGKKQTLDCPFLSQLPAWTPEREAEIIRAAKDKDAK